MFESKSLCGFLLWSQFIYMRLHWTYHHQSHAQVLKVFSVWSNSITNVNRIEIVMNQMKKKIKRLRFDGLFSQNSKLKKKTHQCVCQRIASSKNWIKPTFDSSYFMLLWMFQMKVINLITLSSSVQTASSLWLQAFSKWQSSIKISSCGFVLKWIERIFKLFVPNRVLWNTKKIGF